MTGKAQSGLVGVMFEILNKTKSKARFKFVRENIPVYRHFVR